MLKLKAPSYTVVLNGYSQGLIIKGENYFSSIDISDAGLQSDFFFFENQV